MQPRHVPGAGSSSNLPRRGRYAGTVSRIIAGRHGGHRIKTPPTQLTRPTTDRVREAVFSAIASWNGTADEPVSDALAGIAFADLFAGSGAMGLEAASRGAGPVVCVEKTPATSAIIGANAKALSATVQVVTADVSAWISRSVGAAGNDGTGHGEPGHVTGHGEPGRDNPGHDDTGRYDVMWFDPPYDLPSTKMDELIARATGLLVDSGLLVVERSARTAAPTFPEGMEHWSSSYGQTVVHYAQRADPSQ